MTPFAAALRLCGLSQPEAAAYLNSRIDTVKKWGQGSNPAPEGVMRELADLQGRIVRAARGEDVGDLPGSGRDMATALAMLAEIRRAKAG